MQQRQLRLGDTLDDYCPRERRLTNHAIVAMVGQDVKQVRCTTCDGEHEYKQGKVPRQRKKAESPAALYAQVAANAPKRVAHDAPADSSAGSDEQAADAHEPDTPQAPVAAQPDAPGDVDETGEPAGDAADKEEGPVHRPLIRASLPRPEGQPPPSRPNPEFTIHQPGTRPGRFRPRFPRGGGQQFFGNRSNGNIGSGQRQGGGRPPQGNDAGRPGRRHGRRRPK